ncbi:MAG: PspA/IM30 family protein [Thermodesulfobacteriota bacterium]
MGIMSRLARLVKADVHGVMDHLEDKGLVLSQCLREMEEELINTRNSLAARRDHLEKLDKDLQGLSAQAEKCAADARDAVTREKDDMARHFLRRERVARKCLADLTARRADLVKEINALTELSAARQEEYEKLKIRADHYVAMAAAGVPEQRSAGEAFGANAAFAPDEQEVELSLLRIKEELSGGAS